MSLVLHLAHGSTATIPHAVIEEVGFAYRLQELQRGFDNDQDHDADGVRLTGRVPALEDDGTVVFETGAILLHLMTKPQAAHLMPQYATRDYARFLQWLFYLTTAPKMTLMEIIRPEQWGRYAHEQDYIRTRGEERLATQCDYLDANVSDGTFLPMGLTVLDFYLTELARWSAVAELPMWRWKRIGKIVDMVRARPSYQRMLAMQSLKWPV